MANYLITGCSRDLGLALATQLASLAPSNVGTIFATARSETPALHNLVESCGGRVVFIKLDVTNQPDINDAVKHVESTLQGRGLDVLINNAGHPALHARQSPGHDRPRRGAAHERDGRAYGHQRLSVVVEGRQGEESGQYVSTNVALSYLLAQDL
jgi:NAD(P)-dependent dehydrogenase (short-subunit alcohol dehydrogenase family)